MPVQWNEKCIVVTIDQRGSKDVPLTEISSTLGRALNNWTSRTNMCGGLTLSRVPAYKVLDVAADGLPAVIFRNDVWQRPGHAPHDPAAIGLTTVMYVNTPGLPGDGTILDADIELNNVNYTFTTDPANATARPGTQLADLENTLTHELGHLQGLDHTCADAATPPQEVDDSGNPPPSCDTLGSLPLEEQVKIKLATMYNFAQPGEISKRSPEADDVAGIANAYPPADDPGSCKTTDLDAFKTSGCSIAGRTSRSLAAIAVLLGALVALVARRRYR